jgi:hypothetical protein
LLQTTMRWWEKVPSKPMLHSNDVVDIYATTPSTFPTKKPFLKIDDKSATDTSKRDVLPVFLVDPIDAFIIRSKSAELSCRVVGADKAYFTCNGEAMAAAERHKEEDRIEVAGDQVSKVALLFNYFYLFVNNG